MKIRGVLRDALRQKSVGIIEELPEKGIVKYGKPAGIVACIVPTTNPDLTPAGNAIYAHQGARRRHLLAAPALEEDRRSKRSALMRDALEREGAPADILQCLTKVNIPMSQALMARADLIVATGGQPMVRAAYAPGTPAYGVGAGNSTMVIDETANIEEAARNTRLSQDLRLRLRLLGRRQPDHRGDASSTSCSTQLQKEGGYLATDDEKETLRRAMWDDEGHRTVDTVAISPQQLAQASPASRFPADRKFIIVHGDGIGKEHHFSSEKLTDVAGRLQVQGLRPGARHDARRLRSRRQGTLLRHLVVRPGAHPPAGARRRRVSRIMVRQPQSKANAGAFNNGMPMTSSLGCGTWGGNIISENVHLKHYMNTTWVSVPIKEDKPSDEELFGPFYDPALEAEVETITT